MSPLWAAGLIVLSFGLAAISGAATGMRIGGESLGNGLAALMGALFGPAAVVPAAIAGLALLAWLR
jgi:hypothetical protein